MPAQITINGKVQLTPGDKPLASVSVELWDSINDYGRIANTVTNAAGDFSFTISDPFNAMIESGTVGTMYKILEGDVLIKSQNVTYVAGVVVEIDISYSEYDAIEKPQKQIVIEGTVSDFNGIPVPDTKVNVYEGGFRTKTLLSKVKSDVNGYYKAVINERDINNSVVIAKRSIRIEAVGIDDNDILASSGDIFNYPDIVKADLKLTESYTEASSVFENITTALAEVIGSTDLGTLEVNESTKVNEIRYVAEATGRTEDEVVSLVQAHKFAAEASVEPVMLYAAVLSRGLIDGEVNPMMRMKETELRDAITLASETKKIPTQAPGDVDDFINGVKTYQIATTKGLKIGEETYSVEDVLASIFSSSTAYNSFLSLMNDRDYTDPEDFWNAFEASNGSTARQATQKGFTIANLTGYQPKITAHILAELGSSSIHTLSTWSANTWESHIAAVCDANDELCVPLSIRQEQTDPGLADVHEVYAQILAATFQNMYPLTYISSELTGPDAALLIPHAGVRSNVVTFISNNPAFDVRLHNVFDINSTDYNTSGIADVDVVIDALAPFQRVLRITLGDPEIVCAFIKDGLKSASAISELDEEFFVERYAELINNEEKSRQIYARAVTIANLASHHTADILVNGNKSAASEVLPYMDFTSELGGGAVTEPDFATMFGSQSFCTCERCMSMYSPAAYVTDILSYMRSTGAEPLKAYNELLSRRSDIKYIDLTCKNTNTTMPYVDLVNEILERFIMTTKGISGVPSSFQTSGTPEQLAAYPEHVYKNAGVYTDYTGYGIVYNNSSISSTDGILNNAVYPNVLPFNLALEESRSYLQYLGKPRIELLKSFRPHTAPSYSATNEISDYSIYAELLGLNKVAADIISQAYSSSFYSNIANDHVFYGFTTSSVSGFQDPADSTLTLSGNWYDVLTNRLDVLLQQSSINYKELLQLLITDFVNRIHNTTSPAPHRDVNILNITGKPEETCVVSELKLEFNADNNVTKQAFLNRLHRFIRLYRTNKYSIYQWDIILRSLGITELNSTSKPTTNGSLRDFEMIGKVVQLSEKLSIEPEILAGWWSRLDATSYLNYENGTRDYLPSVYSNIFDNKAVINNAGYNIFADYSAVEGSEYEEHLSRLASLCLIGEGDIENLMNLLGVDPAQTMSHVVISRLYVLSRIAAATGLSVDGLISIIKLSGLLTSVGNFLSSPPYTTGSPSQTYTYTDYLNLLEKLVVTIDAVKNSGLSLDEFDFIVRNVDQQDSYFKHSKDIQPFYLVLRESLLKYPVYNDPASSGTEDIEFAQNRLNQLVSVIYQQFSKEFNVPSKWIQKILDPTGVTTTSSTTSSFSMKILKDNLFRSSSDSLSEGTGTADYYQKYRLVDKISMLTERLEIKTEDFLSLYSAGLPSGTDPLDFNFNDLYTAVSSGSYKPVENTNPVACFEGVLRLAKLIEVRDVLNLKDGSFSELLSIDYVTVPSGTSTAKAAWLAFFDKNTSWGASLEELVGDEAVISSTAGAETNLLRTTFPGAFALNSYSNLDRLLTINKIVAISKRTGLLPLTLQKTLRPDLLLADSQKILLAAKGKQTDENWQKVAKPLRDVIRAKQRKALTAYAIANPPAGNKYPWKNENDLYAYLLIDVEMEPVMMTSRLKQAINSIQLFIDRVMLNLEWVNGDRGISGVSIRIPHTSPFAIQWKKWRKWYGIWEANRQVFLYPENWLEPSLRDDKTEFFREFEAQLLQEEITDKSVEAAMRTYLQNLDDVSRLEPVGVCDSIDPVTNKYITHAFSRTYGNPQQYYYRTLIDDAWSGWQKMDIDMKGNHIAPIVWNNRVYVFWTTCTEKKIKANQGPGTSDVGGLKHVMNNWGGNNSQFFYNDPLSPSVEPDPNDKDAGFYHQLEFTLNWTEYKDGKWQKQKVGKETAKVTLNPYLSTSISAYMEHPTWDIFKIIPFYKNLTNGFSSSLIDMIKSRVFLQPIVPIQSRFRVPLNPYELRIHLQYPHRYNTGDETVLYLLKSFLLTDQGAEPVVSDITNGGWGILPPAGTLVKNMHMIQNQPWATDGVLYRDNFAVSTKTNGVYVYDLERKVTASTIDRTTSEAILDRTPADFGKFKVKPKSNFRNHPMENQFFYIDGPNTFFARTLGTPIGTWYANDVAYLPTSTVGSPMLPASPGKTNTPIRTGETITLSSHGGEVFAVATNTPFLVVANSSNTVFATTSVPVSAGGGTVIYKDPGLPSTPVNRIPSGKATYFFQTFFHPHMHSFLRAIYTGGIPELLKLSSQIQQDGMKFRTTYQPTTLVYDTTSYPLPDNKVDFTYKGAYSIYNWEIFFHIPMMIAQGLSNNQKFEEAQKWYHYIFNPTSTVADDDVTPTNSKARFWRFRPFYDTASNTILSLHQILLEINNPASLSAGSTSVKQVEKMGEDPMNPFAIARYRTVGFMKNVVLKYLDNLIAWADSLFTRNTIESINEATQLYILASNILGKRPEEVMKRAQSNTFSFNDLGTTIDKFGNARVAIENYIDYNAAVTTPGTPHKPNNVISMMFYFCTPENKELLKYWDIVADRLFKIRNSLNIKGQVNKLPLFEPPINPAMLVRAAASGVDFGSVLDDMGGANIPNYRFNYIVQKANEYCGDVKALGGALLSALEKKDAEELALIRSGLEAKVLQSTLLMKQTQLKEANANLESLYKTKEITSDKFNYYNSRQFQNDREREHLSTLAKTIELQRSQAIMSAISSGMALIPQFHIQAFSAVGPSWGGQQLSTIFQAISTNLGFQVAMKNTSASIASTVGGYERRRDEWRFQAQAASKELEQIDKQIVSAQIRIELAQKDVDSQVLQIENNQFVDEFMRNKYTNKELYSWMITQISTTYFQAYQIAYKMARKAVQCYNHELPFAKQKAEQIVTMGYWDSLKKGLLVGEKLQLDLRKLEMAYIEENERELELTKHVSLAMLDADSLLTLKREGACEFTIPTWLYNLDFPGHYNRRIKSVSISIPCVAGPYTTISAELSLGQSYVYGKDSSEPTISNPSGSPVSSFTSGGIIATSSAQNDNGVFDFNFRDERYLPFEGRGAHSSWGLSLMQDPELRQFDYSSISDVIVHIKYTARTDGNTGSKANASISDIKSRIEGSSSVNSVLPRIFSLTHEFSSEWGAGFASTTNVGSSHNVGHKVNLALKHEHFPVYCQGKSIHFKNVTLHLVVNKNGVTKEFDVDIKLNTSTATPGTISLQSSIDFIHAAALPATTMNEGDTCNLSFTFYHEDSGAYTEVDMADIKDCYAVVDYYLS